MYVPSHFEENSIEVLHDFVHAHPFGLLVTSGGALGLQANAIPFLLDRNAGPKGTLLAHVARSNPVWRDVAPGSEVLAVFQGPQAYVSPNWYPTKAETGKAVPTWNYVMVQARGRLRVIDDREELRGIVTRLTLRHESTQPRPWQVGDAPPEFIDTLLGAIIGLEVPVDAIQGKWKLSQNRPAADREGMVKNLQERGSELAPWAQQAHEAKR